MQTNRSTVLISGASRGIGLAISRLLLEQGFHVIGLSRHPPEKQHPNFHHEPIDLSQLNQLEKQLKTIKKKHPQINHLICNAGRGLFGSLEQLSSQQIKDSIDLNLTSQILLTKTFLPHLKTQQQGGRIIFMGSESALKGGQKGSVYSASKFAIRGFAQSLREESSRSGICISLINPGMVKSPFFDDLNFAPGNEIDQHLTPEDVAQSVLMLLQARYGNCIEEINLSPQKKVILFDP